MRLKFKWIYTLLLAFIMQISFAQTKTINGTVSEGGMPLPGVSVVKKGSTEGTQTDLDGKYSIQAKQGDVLVFSFVGMTTKEVSVGASNSINVGLDSESNVLEGIVVEGYRQTSKVKSANAVVTVSAEAIQDRPNANFIQTLQGQVAGLQIATGSGQPGANSTVVLRGRGSINGNVEPLYVIDGVQMNTDNFRSINPNEIESVSVLKDAGATAIYGNRGGNGVIIITTKSGKFNQKLKAEYTTITGFSTLQKHDYNIANTSQLLQLERSYGSGLGRNMTDDEIKALNAQVNTKWTDVFFRTASTQSHNLSLSSGSDNLTAFNSFSYFKQDGIIENSGLQRFNFRSNLQGKSANGKFKYGTKVSANYSINNEVASTNSGDSNNSNVNANPLIGALMSLPYLSPDTYTGSQDLLDLRNNTSNTMTLTPFYLMDRIKTGTIQRNQEVKLLTSAFMSYEFAPNFIAKTQIGADYNVQNTLNWLNPTSYNSLSVQQNAVGVTGAPPVLMVGSESQANARDIQITSTSSINYSNTFKEKHNLNAGLYFEVHKGHYRYFAGSQSGIDPIFGTPGDNSGWTGFNPAYPNYNRPSFSASKLDAALMSYFVNADYDYDGRFGLNATLRRDGTYRFIDENKWGTFWSVAGRWNITNEKFMDGTSTWLNELKLRGSYGSNGNQLISGQSLYSGPNLFADMVSVGTGYNGNPAFLFGRLGNEALRWEKIIQTNIGIDFGLFNNRLIGNVDVYEKKTEDLFQSVPLSAITGFTSISSNSGSMRNRGVELFLNYHLIKNEGNGFNLKLNFNGSYNKNQILDLPTETGVDIIGLYANKVGSPMYQFYVHEYAGVNPANGNLLFFDANGGYTENPTDADRKFTGKSAYNPKFQGGFGLDAEYRNFFVNGMFTYVTDIYRWDDDLYMLSNPGNIGTFNQSADLLNAWTPDNRITTVPSLKADNFALAGNSSMFIRDASYLRLRSAMFGYNFDRKTLESFKIKSFRLYVQGENLVTWSKWRGWDAESNRAGDFFNFPTPKIVSFGVQIGL